MLTGTDVRVLELQREKETWQREKAALVEERDAERQRAQTALQQLRERQEAERNGAQRLLEEEMRHSSLLQAMSVVVDFADFTDVQLLAKGCCGIVMRAKVRAQVVADLVEHVAVKMMTNYGTDTFGAVKNFQTEYALLAGLRHPGISHVYRVLVAKPTEQMAGFIEDVTVRNLLRGADGIMLRTVGLVMPLYSSDLSKLLSDTPLLPTARRREMCLQVWRALRYLDAKRVAHLDMKLDNIFVDANGNIVLGDFGMARRIDADGTVDADGGLGNAMHRAPELERASKSRVQRLPVQKQAVWEGGVVAYEILCGQHPFGREYPLLGIEERQYQLDRGLLTCKAGDPAMEQAVLRMLRWSPAERYAWGDAAVQALMGTQ